MKNIIKILGILLVLAAIAAPAFAQAPRPSESIRVITPQANAVGNLLHRNMEAGSVHYYRVNNLTDPFYYVLWRDYDDSRNLSSPIGDVRISIINLTTGMILANKVDYDTTMSEERLVNAIEINRGVHYNSGNDILIIVEDLGWSGGNYAILVY